MPKKKNVRKIKPWKWSTTFTMDWVVENVRVLEFGYGVLREENDRRGALGLQEKFQTRVKALSTRMTEAILQQPNSEALLSKLAERCDSCVRMYGYLDSNLSRETLNWGEVITALAHLKCYVQGLEDTLVENGIREAH